MFKKSKKLLFFLPLALALTCFFALFIALNSNLKAAIRSHIYESQYKYTESKSTFSPGTDLNITNTNDGLLDSVSAEGIGLFYRCKSDECVISYPFRQLSDIRKVSILFDERIPETNDIRFRTDFGQLNTNLIIRRCKGNSKLCTFYIKSGVKTKLISVYLRNATYSNFGVQEIKFYQTQNKNIVSVFFDFFTVWPRSYISNLIYPLLFFVAFLIPGLLMNTYLRKKMDVTLLTSLLLSTFLFLVLASISLFVPDVFVKIFFFIEFLIFSFMLIIKKDIHILKFLKVHKILLCVYLIATLYLSFCFFVRDYSLNNFMIEKYDFNENYNTLVPMVPFGSYEVDFLIPYHSAINFISGGEALRQKIGTIYNLTDRTPIISFISIAFMKAFGLSEFIYQMVVIMLSALFIIPVFYLSSAFMSRKKSYIISLILSFSHFFTFVTFFGAAKTITLFFILGSAYYLLKRRPNYFRAGIFMATAYFTHPFALICFLSYGLFVFVKKRKSLLYFLIPTFVLVLIWSIFSYSLGRNNEIFYSVATQSSWVDASSRIVNPANFDSEFKKPVFITRAYWLNKYYNLIGLFVFLPKIYYDVRFFDFYRTTIPGSVTLTGCLALIMTLTLKIFVAKTRLHSTVTNSLIYFIIVPVVLTLLYQGFYIQMGLMWYVLVIVPFLVIILGYASSLNLLKIIGALVVSESFYARFIFDAQENERLLSILGTNKIYLGLVYLCILLIYVQISELISHDNHRT